MRLYIICSHKDLCFGFPSAKLVKFETVKKNKLWLWTVLIRLLELEEVEQKIIPSDPVSLYVRYAIRACYAESVSKLKWFYFRQCT